VDRSGCELGINQALEHRAPLVGGADLGALALQVALAYRFQRMPVGFGGTALVHDRICTVRNLAQDGLGLLARLLEVEHRSAADGVAPALPAGAVLRYKTSVAAHRHHQAEAWKRFVPVDDAIASAGGAGGGPLHERGGELLDGHRV